MHLALIIWFFASISNSGPPIAVLFVGGAGYVLLYMMLITSINGPAAAIGSVGWRRLHKTGLYWIGAVFAVTYVPKFLAQSDNPAYLISTLLIISAVGIRVVVFLRHSKQGVEPQSFLSGSTPYLLSQRTAAIELARCSMLSFVMPATLMRLEFTM